METEENIEQNRIRRQIEHFIEIGRYEKIKSLASDLISGYPEYGYGYYAMALYEDYRDRTENAIELCHKAAEYGMSRLQTGFMLMIYYENMDDYSNSDAEYDALMQQYPFCYDAMAIHGHFLWNRGNKDEGIVLMQKAFAEDPSDPTIIKKLLTAVKKGKDAEMLLKLYMDSRASDNQKLKMAGIHEIHRNNWKEAKNCFEKVLGMDPMDEEALYFMAIINMRRFIPKLLIFAVVFSVLIYLFKFNPQKWYTYLYFLLPIPILLFVAFMFARIRSISGNRGKTETKIVNSMERTLRADNRTIQKRNESQGGRRFNEACLKFNRKMSRFAQKLIFASLITFILLGVVVKMDEINYKEHAVTVMAEVVGFSEMGYPIISFVSNGKEYKVLSRTQIPNASIGSNVEIQYHSEHPNNIQYGENPLYKLAIPMIILGSIVSLGYGYFVFRK